MIHAGSTDTNIISTSTLYLIHQHIFLSRTFGWTWLGFRMSCHYSCSTMKEEDLSVWMVPVIIQACACLCQCFNGNFNFKASSTWGWCLCVPQPTARIINFTLPVTHGRSAVFICRCNEWCAYIVCDFCSSHVLRRPPVWGADTIFSPFSLLHLTLFYLLFLILLNNSFPTSSLSSFMTWSL